MPDEPASEGSGCAAIVGLSGERLSADEIAMLREFRPLGVVLFRRNVPEDGSPAALADAVRDVLGDGALLMVDQEGGRVARLRPPRFLAHPPASWFGALGEADPARAERAAFLTGALIGLDARAAGCDVVAAPVLDLAVPGADAVIGDRAFAADGRSVARLGAALADGLQAAGCQPVGKHAPGHGRATLDSHAALPLLDEVDERDLVPFRLLSSRLGWMMTAHIVYRDVDPDRPATLSAEAIERVIRHRIGFEGVLVSDDLAMGAVRDGGDPGAIAARALRAGCDVALHCNGVFADTVSVLRSVGPPTADALRRLRLAAAAAAARRVALDRDALRSEREAIIG